MMLARLRVRSKLFLLALGPICLLAVVLSGITISELRNLSLEQEAKTRARDRLRSSLMEIGRAHV